MISKKAIMVGLFSAIVGVGMLAMPVRAMAHDWDHDGDGGRHGHHDNGNHNGWYNHGGNDEEEEEEHENRGYYQQPSYNYGYQQPWNDEEEDENEGYGYSYGNRYRYPTNGQGMISRRNPGLVWSCDSQGHHCHWARRSGYGAYNPYGNGYYGNSGYSPLGGLGSLLGIPMP